MAANPIPFNTGMSGEEINTAFKNALTQFPEHASNTDSHTSPDEKSQWNNSVEQSAINRTSLGTQVVNLLENRTPTYTAYGVTVTPNDDGSIMLNGTATETRFIVFNLQSGATSYAEQFDNVKHIPTGKYIMSGGTASAPLQLVRSSEEGKEGTIVTCSGADVAVEVTDEDLYTWCRLRVTSGEAYEAVTVYPMIRPAEVSDGTYKPYKPSLQKQIDDLTARIAALEAAAQEV